jgi:kynurenine formamidase
MTAALAGRHKVVDLSLSLAAGYPSTWPGHAPFETRAGADFATGQPYRTASIAMDEHAGTHVDAPSHSIEEAGDSTVAHIPLGDLMGPAVVIDAIAGAPSSSASVRSFSGESASGCPGRSPRVGVTVIHAFERLHGPIRPCEILLLRTGWDARYASGVAGWAYLEAPLHGAAGWPAPDEEFLEAIRVRGVRCLGTDAPSVGALDDPGFGHESTLRHGIWPIEGLANLAALPARGAMFLFLPLKLNGSGAPGRAVAFVPTRP